MPGIARSSFLKMLGINIENNFSIAQHVQRLVAASAQSLYAMRVLRMCRLDDDALQHIFRATVVARLTYAASAWRGLTKAPDRKHIDSVLNRVQRHGYYAPDQPTFDELCNSADDELYVLDTLITSQTSASQRYNLRCRSHSLQLPSHTTCLSDSNFIIRIK